MLMGYQLDLSIIIKYLPLFLKGILLTCEISFFAILIGLVIGILGAVARISQWTILRFAGAAYVEVFRNTPLLIQIFIIYFGLPGIGLKLSPYVSGLTALVLYVGAYNTEVIRAGLEAVPKGQFEIIAHLQFPPTLPLHTAAQHSASAAERFRREARSNPHDCQPGACVPHKRSEVGLQAVVGCGEISKQAITLPSL